MAKEWGKRVQDAMTAFAQKGVHGDAHQEWSNLAQAASNAGFQADYLTEIVTDLIEATIFREATLAEHGRHSPEYEKAQTRYNEAFNKATIVAFTRPPSAR